MGVLIDRVLLRRLEGAGAAAYVVASLGLLVALQGLAVAIYGGEPPPGGPIFPTGTYRLPGVRVGIDQAVVVAVAIAAGVGLALFFRGTHLGPPDPGRRRRPGSHRLVGTNSGWVTTALLDAGLRLRRPRRASSSPRSSGSTPSPTLLVVQAFGAAVVGRLRSLPLTNLGAYGIGIAAALATKFVSSRPEPRRAADSALPFIVLFVVLVFSPKGRFVEAAKAASARRGPAGRAVARPKLPVSAVAAIAGVAAVLPAVLNGSQLLTATTTVAFVLIFASLCLLVGLSRQVSLCHAVFVVFGATTLSHFLQRRRPLPAGAAPRRRWPWCRSGRCVAIPAIRLSGLFLALATFGFGILAQNLLFPTSIAFGSGAVAHVARPAGARGRQRLLLPRPGRRRRRRARRRGRPGHPPGPDPAGAGRLAHRRSRASASTPTASRVIVFCLSAFLAAVAGGLLGSLFQSSTRPASTSSSRCSGSPFS